MIRQERIDREKRVLGLEIEHYRNQIHKLMVQVKGYESSIQRNEEGLALLEKDPEAYFRNPDEEEDETK